MTKILLIFPDTPEPVLELLRRQATLIGPLDAPDDCLSDAGALADLRNGETGPAPCFCQGVTNAHAASTA